MIDSDVPVTVSDVGRLTTCEVWSVRVTVKLNEPTTVGVPLREPVVESDTPVGSAPSVIA